MTHTASGKLRPNSTSAATAAELLAENQALRARMTYLLEQAERNHSIMTRHQAFDLEIVGAANFPELIGIIFRVLPVISELDCVTLTLVDEDADIREVMLKLDVVFEDFPGLIFVEAVDAMGLELAPRNAQAAAPRPQLGMYDPRRHAISFPKAPAGLQSVALVPLLRNKRIIGSLNLGSCDPTRFTPSLGTDFIEHMASIIAICLENVISNEMLNAAFVAERIRASVAGSMIALSQELQLSVTVSIGVACLAPGEAEGDPAVVARTWVAQADARLYVAKESGRNRVISRDADADAAAELRSDDHVTCFQFQIGRHFQLGSAASHAADGCPAMLDGYTTQRLAYAAGAAAQRDR
eukprot:gene8874-8685_t